MLSERRLQLLHAQDLAKKLFHEVEIRNLIEPGRYESEVNERIYVLARELFGIKKYWHKRIVRAGINTLCPYRENPPDLQIEDNDIVFLDFGPIFDSWEADFGQTFVLGSDPETLAMKDDVKDIWDAGRAFFEANPLVRAHDIFAYLRGEAGKKGYAWVSAHCGHLIGEFPHENIPRNQKDSFLTKDNCLPLRRLGSDGRELDWILEVHITKPDRARGAFHEELLTV